MPEVVKVKVFYFEFAALTPKRCSNRLSIVGKYPAKSPADIPSLLLDYGVGVVACGV